MSAQTRRAFATIGIGLGLLVLVLALLPTLLPRERVKAWVLSKAEASLHRPIAVETVSMSLLPVPRVRLDGITIGDAPGRTRSRFTLETLKLQVRLWPLLRQRIEVVRIELERPFAEITLADPASADSAAIAAGPGALAAAAGAGAGAGAATRAGAAGPLDSPPADIHVQALVLRGGRVRVLYPDGRPFVELGGIGEELHANATMLGEIRIEGETTIDSARVYLPAGTFGRGIPIRLHKNLVLETARDLLTVREATLQLGDLSATVTGTVAELTRGARIADLHVTGGPADIGSIFGYLPEPLFAEVAGARSGGTLELHADLRGPLGSPPGAETGAPAPWPDFAVTLALTGGHVEHPRLPAPIEDVTLRLRANPDTIDVREFTARSGESRIAARATAVRYRVRPYVTIAVDAAVDLAAAAALQPSTALTLAGYANAQLVISGFAAQPEAMTAVGTIELRGVALTTPQLALPLGGLDADLALHERELIIQDLRGSFGQSDFNLKGRVENYRALDLATPGGDAAKVELRLRSRRLDLDQLLVPPAGTPVPTAAALASILTRVEGVVALEADEVRVNRATLRDAHGRARLDRGLVRLDAMTLRAFDGTLAGEGLVDLRRAASPHFDARLQARGVQAGALYTYAASLSRLTRLGGFLNGELDITASLAGDLTDSLALKLDTFTTNGTLQTRAASLSGQPLLHAIAGFLDAPQLGQLAITDWLQPFRIANGRLSIDGMNLKAGGVELTARGWQAIDGSLEYAFELLLPPALTNGLRAKLPADLLPVLFDGSGGRVLVPLAVSGRLPQPSIEIDTGRLRAGAQRLVETRLAQERERLKREALSEAGDFLKGMTGAGADTTRKEDEEKGRDARKEVDELLRNLLHRK
jgi:hypothetical protein